MFIFLGIIYLLILFIAYFGDYKTKELEKDKQTWEKILGKKYY